MLEFDTNTESSCIALENVIVAKKMEDIGHEIWYDYETFDLCSLFLVSFRYLLPPIVWCVHRNAMAIILSGRIDRIESAAAI